MRKFLLIGILLCTGCEYMQAQFSEQLSFPNWYISLYSGFNVYFSENNIPGAKNSNFSLSSNLNTLSTVGVGYDISKIFSARGQLGWIKYRWGTENNSSRNAWAGTLTADMMLNFTRLIADYDPNRNFEMQFFVGSGVAYRPGLKYTTYSSASVISPIARTGIQLSYFVSRRFVISLDLATNFVSDKMDDVGGSRLSDNYTSLMLGFTYHIVGCNCHFKPHNQTY